MAYASLGCGDLLSKQAVVQVASECCMTPAQVLLRWGLHKGCAVIPKSCRPERIAEASEPQLLPPGAGLTDGQMALLDSLEDGHKYCWDPSGIS